MSDVSEFGFGSNDELVGKKSSRFKAEAGRTYRISFAYYRPIEGSNPPRPNLKESPRFLAAKRLYIEGVGYVIDKGPEIQKLAGGQKGKTQVGTIIIVWPSDPKTGDVSMSAVSEGRFSAHSWIFSEDKYLSLRSKHSEFPLGTHDIRLTCTDAQFQKMDFTPCRDSLFAKMLDLEAESAAKGKTFPLIAKILDEVDQIAGGLADEIGRVMTPDQIREKLAGKGGGGGGFGKGSSSGSPAPSSQQFDSMLGDLLGDK